MGWPRSGPEPGGAGSVSRSPSSGARRAVRRADARHRPPEPGQLGQDLAGQRGSSKPTTSTCRGPLMALCGRAAAGLLWRDHAGVEEMLRGGQLVVAKGGGRRDRARAGGRGRRGRARARVRGGVRLGRREPAAVVGHVAGHAGTLSCLGTNSMCRSLPRGSDQHAHQALPVSARRSVRWTPRRRRTARSVAASRAPARRGPRRPRRLRRRPALRSSTARCRSAGASVSPGPG